MSAGEVDRLVSELSGGTGGDEEEEWLYGGTELPVPCPSAGVPGGGPPGPARRPRGLRAAPRPSAAGLAAPGPASRRRPGCGPLRRPRWALPPLGHSR